MLTREEESLLENLLGRELTKADQSLHALIDAYMEVDDETGHITFSIPTDRIDEFYDLLRATGFFKLDQNFFRKDWNFL